MKNIFEIMKEYGIDMPEDKKKDFEKSVLENYKTVADYNKQVENLNKANDTIKSNDTAMKKLQDKLDAFKDVDVTELKNTIAGLEKDKTRIEDEYKDKMAKRDFDDLIKDAITSAHGKNAKAITALLDVDTLMQSKNQKEDVAAAIKKLTEAEDSKMLFGEPEPQARGGGNPIGDIGDGSHPNTTDSISSALKEFYKK
ncbi:phage scaffolding protein [Agathobacter rectalis]|uniref:Phage minor structural protein GP20 n=1 Tax=Agathobacter rectalis TaxID=39491 RepID=A0A174GWW4_9FIRM|nr:phage scaffolding protein [Agathobacter rectalis]CUO65717.1 Phage minor structural protein GP20 [Agathobacter rectalis]